MRAELAQNCLRTADRLDVPGQRQHIAPMTVGMKQGLEAGSAWCCERAFELRQPTLRSRRDAICSGQHGRYTGGLRRNCRFGLKVAYRPELRSVHRVRPILQVLAVGWENRVRYRRRVGSVYARLRRATGA